MRAHAKLLATIALIMAPGTAWSQSASGDWWGVLEIAPGARLRLALHVKPGADGTLAATLDSIDQNAAGMPIADIKATGGRLAFSLTTPPASFEGQWDAAAKSWLGAWRQAGQSWPLVFAAGKPPASAPPPPLPADWAIPSDGAITALIDARIAARQGAGIVAGVLDPAGRRIVARGPAGAGAAFDGRTLFEIGSMSKVFTALILADMVSKHEVALDDPAEKYLPAGAKMPERGRKITLRDLATHMSGLPRLPDNMPYGNPDDPYADYSEALLLDFLGRYQLPRDVGSQFEYSNLGFGLLGHLLARAAHTDYASLLAQRITGPLGMRDTVITLSPEQQARFAQGHDPYMRRASPWTLPTLAGAGAIRSTADDMLIFVRAALDPKSPIGPAMALATTERRPMGASGSTIGLAWIVASPAEGRQTLFHNGGTGGFRSAMMLEPARRRAVVVLTNAAVEPAVDDLAMHLLLGTAVKPATPVPPAPPPAKAHTEITLPPAELDRVVGRYAFSPELTLTVQRSAAGLTAQLTGQPPFPIYAEAPLGFFWRVVDAQVRFTLGPDGSVTGAVVTQAGQQLNGKRVVP